jgi:hypothetical protein
MMDGKIEQRVSTSFANVLGNQAPAKRQKVLKKF